MKRLNSYLFIWHNDVLKPVNINVFDINVDSIKL